MTLRWCKDKFGKIMFKFEDDDDKLEAMMNDDSTELYISVFDSIDNEWYGYVLTKDEVKDFIKALYKMYKGMKK